MDEQEKIEDTQPVAEAKTRSTRLQWFLVALCWLAYFATYVGRYSYNSNVTQVQKAYGIENNSSMGIVSTCFFIAYGVGQIVNGFMCKHYPKRIVLTLALLVSAAVNLSFVFSIPFSAIKYVWLINGIAQSFMWSSLICILGEYLDTKLLTRAVIFMSATYACGTFVAYGLSAVCAKTQAYRIVFGFAACLLAGIAVVWFFGFGKVSKKLGKFISVPENKGNSEKVSQKRSIPVSVWITFGFLAVFAIVDNFVKDGLGTWVPSILQNEFHLSDSLSIFLTLFLPVVSIFATALSEWLNLRLKNDFVTSCTIFFGVSAILIGCVMALLGTNLWFVVVVCFCGISCFMAGINHLITASAPLRMREYLNSGMTSGVLDGFCYIGSALSSYGLGAISDSSGWGTVFKVFLVGVIVPMIFGIVYFSVKKLHKH